MKPVVCIGELLIDFICTDIDTDLKTGHHFIKKSGGAPANVAAAIAKLGGESCFAGKVGNDSFGHYLEEELKRYAVDTGMLLKDDEKKTTLAFVSLTADGERDFSFVRGADGNLKFEELDRERLESSRIIHFGSATGFLGDELEKTYLELMAYAASHQHLISFDPNYRDALWENREVEFVRKINASLEHVDILKVSEEELHLLTEEPHMETAMDKLHGLGAKIVMVTLGKDGVYLSNGKKHKLIGSPTIKSVDSTGAGDAFVGGVLYLLNEEGEPKEAIHDFEKICQVVEFAAAVGALTCTQMGAMESLPELEDVKVILQNA